MTTSTRSARRGGKTEARRETLLTDFPLTPVSPDERRRAALAVCDRVRDVADAREILAALGLLDDVALRGAA